MEEKKKKFSLASAILMVICVVFVAEAAPVVASMGNSQYIWWLILIALFLLPYGLISAELSSAYDDEGGLYDWTKRAFGPKWGTRVSWYYWINFPIWMGSLALLFPIIINFLADPSGATTLLDPVAAIVVGLVYIVVVTLVAFLKASDSAIILNIGAILKIALALLLLVLGIITFAKNGFVGATDFTLESFAPFSEFSPLGIILGLGATTIILFNFMGFEVISSASSEMENPKKQLPTAIIAGGIAIAAVYIMSSFGIGVAIPPQEIAADMGIVDAVNYMVGAEAFWLVVAAGILFLVTLVGNMVSWSYGVNYVASYGARNGDMPRIFGSTLKRNDMPLGAPIINAIVAAVVLIAGVILPEINPSADAMFWAFFSLSIITLLMSYIPMFPAWLRLRKTDPDTERGYSVPGGPVLNKLFAYVPVLILVITLVCCLMPVPENEITESDITDYVAMAVSDGVSEDEAYTLADLEGAEDPDSYVAKLVSVESEDGEVYYLVDEDQALVLADEYAVGSGDLVWTEAGWAGVAPTIVGVILAFIAGEILVVVLSRKKQEA